jgi:NADH:ubiquinone oxidoreductase subunit F (NADH-binding)/(2Fe-2S) ferredoxin/ferredoxin
MAHRAHLMVCAGTGCVSNHSLELRDALRAEIEKRGLTDEVAVFTTGCHGFCGAGPIVLAQPDGIFYQKITGKDIPELVEEHMVKGRPVKRLMYVPPSEKEPVPLMRDIGFFSDQLLDPENIDEYIARDGYRALHKVLTTMTPEQVIDEIHRSGLRGRGGGGFPAGIKWRTCREAPSEDGTRYVICNADEGDPGAFMDRSIIEGDPHSVLEGMAIGAYAVGARRGYLYVRMEYPLAVERFKIAIRQAREYGLLGEDILGSGFDFDLEVRRGAGLFVCGESTALMASIEGKVGEPRAKYIHTVENGLWNHPTVLNNVETWANVPVIMLRGADWFTTIGPGDVSKSPWDGCKGTKVFSLAGRINNTGLVEVPMGITLRKMIFDIGGGIPEGRRFKAVQTGGPSGGFIPESLLDLPIDYDALVEAGSMMGSGGMVILDETSCMVDAARYFIDFLEFESCGKCTPCREGLRRMHAILKDICEGRGRPEHIDLLNELAQGMTDASLCALGTSAPNPVLTTLRYFRDEYEAHILEKRCPAGVCPDLITYEIDPEKCNGCTLCARECPVRAILGEPKQLHILDQEKCIKCGACIEVCKPNAIFRSSGNGRASHTRARAESRVTAQV